MCACRLGLHLCVFVYARACWLYWSAVELIIIILLTVAISEILKSQVIFQYDTYVPLSICKGGLTGCWQQSQPPIGLHCWEASPCYTEAPRGSQWRTQSLVPKEEERKNVTNVQEHRKNFIIKFFFVHVAPWSWRNVVAFHRVQPYMIEITLKTLWPALKTQFFPHSDPCFSPDTIWH